MIQMTDDKREDSKEESRPRGSRKVTYTQIIKSLGEKSIDKMSGTQIFLLLMILGMIALVGMFMNWSN